VALLFISDLHLSAERPDRVDAFERFIATTARGCDGLYILGDLFDLWLGDDDDTDPHPRVLAALARLTGAGTRLVVSLGNRDFLLAQRFADRTGAVLLPDYQLEHFYGVATLLTHGDLLCTRDLAYQEFRQQVRAPGARRAFLDQPLAARRALAARMREGTRASMLEKPAEVMDVEAATVDRVMSEWRATRPIHGHTHRPGIHHVDTGEWFYERIVLGDWYARGEVAILDAEGARLVAIDDLLSA
jgi:UDP-2,3-diacylglucosamine hydrolase